MPFIGKTPETGAFRLIDSITTSATDTYALTVQGDHYFPASARNLIVSLNGVTQAPETAYTVSGSHIVFASALTSSDVIDYILVIGDAVDIGTPSDGTVGDAQLKASLDLSGKTLTFANDQISGNAVDGGTISNFASTGIDDNATSTAITIDSSQNVGIGTTSPSTYDSRTNNLVVGDSGDAGITIFSGATSNAYLQFAPSGDTGLNNGLIDYDNNNDSMAFATGGSERMRIDSSGNVVIGSGGLDVSGIGGSYKALNMRAGSGYPVIYGQTTATSTNSAGVQVVGATSGASAGGASELLGVIQIAAQSDSSTHAAGYINFYTGNGSGGVPERMRIDSSGNVGIGTTSPFSTARLQVKTGTNVNLGFQTGTTETSGFKLNAYNDAGNANIPLELNGSVVLLKTSETERMRITSSGNLLVGTTSSIDGRVSINAFTSNSGCIATSNNGLTVYYPAFFYHSGSLRGYIATTSSSTQYATSSDARLKENIVDAPAGNIDDIRVRSFDWKADGTHQTYGVIAQELVEVAPEAVSQGATEDSVWGVDYSKLVPMMIKEIQDLKAEVAALKGAN